MLILSTNKFYKTEHRINPVFCLFAGAEGIEPTLSVLETDVLPLN